MSDGQQAARKRLEQRRIAYDTSLTKMQKAKREDFRVEEELRAQKAKYEEASEDVHRRMEDIREAESESVADLTAFLDAELAYFDASREILLQCKRDWPASHGYASDMASTKLTATNKTPQPRPPPGRPFPLKHRPFVRRPLQPCRRRAAPRPQNHAARDLAHRLARSRP